MPLYAPLRLFRNTLRGYYWALYSIVIAVFARILRLTRQNATKNQKPRKPSDAKESLYWLWNMRQKHGFSLPEVSLATGFSISEIHSLIDRPGDFADCNPLPENRDVITLLPYPGGRHPRLGFRDGALFPQRETKVSLFAPRDPQSYAVIDIPEAIFSNLGLIYLAHTHIRTRWDRLGIDLKSSEWRRHRSGTLSIHRRLPLGIEFDVNVTPYLDFAIFRLSLTNRGPEPLSRLRVQICVLLGKLRGFESQSNRNKIFEAPSVACRSRLSDNWIIAHSNPCWRVWANPLCPCIHADARLDDCGPGNTSATVLRVGFYTGKHIYEEFRRLNASDWPGPRRPYRRSVPLDS